MDMEEVGTQNTLRDVLESSFDAAENGTLNTPVEKEVITESKPRDETGKFTSNPSPVASKHDVPDPVDHSEPALTRPSTWKKEYLPLWDKMQSGQPLTQEESVKFLQYANQRESEYKTGVSTYKTEAENAKVLQEAISPFLPELQKNGIHPAAWINNLGRAHQTLAMGSSQQKLDMFVKLANDYQVPLQALLGGQEPNQQTSMQMQEIAQLKEQIDKLSNWTENEKNQRLTQEIERYKSDVEHFPHFDQVRETMAQLLESGLAPNLETAYAKAVRMQDDVWQIEQDKLLSNMKTESSKSQQVAKAKATAVSPKSSTPSGKLNSGNAKDRRSSLESAFESFGDGRV